MLPLSRTAMLIAMFFILAMVIPLHSVEAQTIIYVDASADTATADGTADHPYPGIDMALKETVDNDTLLVSPGTYGNAYLRDVGYTSSQYPANLVIKSTDGADATFVDGSKTVCSYGRMFYASGGWLIDGFTFINIGQGFDSGYGCGVYNKNTDTTVVNEVRNCVFDGANINAFWVQKNTKVEAHHNIFANAGGYAVITYGFLGFYNNTLVGMGDHAIKVCGDGGSNGVTVAKNNIFANNVSGIFREGDSFAYSSYNLYYNNTTDTTSITSDGGNNVHADPLFVDAENDDYRLCSDSPAIDAGTDVGLPYEGSAPNMGAYEGIGVLTTIYVDASADTATADGTADHPYPGIDMACMAAEDGATILVSPGTYGNAYIGSPRPANLTIQSTDGADVTIVDGSETLSGSGIVFRAGDGWTVDGFKFINIGEGFDSGYACGVYNNNSDTTFVNEVCNCIFVEPNRRGIWVQKFTTALIHHNVFVNAGENAIISYGSPEVYNNTIFGTSGEHSDNAGIIQMGDGGSNGILTAKNNIFVNNAIGIKRKDDSFAYSSYNLYFGNTVDRIDVTNDEGGNVEADPLFVDTTNYDFHVEGISPAIDAGIDVGLPYEGTAPDMGAYETQKLLSTVYVDASADSATADGTEEHPFTTISEAIGVVIDSITSVIYVSPGTYGPIYNPDRKYIDFTIQSTDGPESTILDHADNPDGYGMAFRINKNNNIIDGFKFVNINANYGGFYSWNEPANLEVRNCIFVEPKGAHLFHLNKSLTTKLHHNVFIRPFKAVALSYGNTEVYNNTVYGVYHEQGENQDGAAFAALGDGGSDGVLTVRNNILYGIPDSGSVGLRRKGDSYLIASNNLYFNNAVDTLIEQSTTYTFTDEGGNVYADPLFVDLDNDDYRLYSESPAIDAGTDVGLPYEGSAPDMGAYEGIGVLTTIYVDASADTATADGTAEHPYPGIDMACMAAEDGATILVAPGTYGNVYIGSPRPANLTIQSTDGADVTIVDGSETTGGYGIVFRAGEGWTVDGFTFINIGDVDISFQGYACGVYLDHRVGGVGDPEIVSEVCNCIFVEPNRRGIWVQKFTTALIHHNVFVNAGENAIISYGDPEVYNNTIVGTSGEHGDNAGIIQMGDGGSNGILTAKNNIFVDNAIGIKRKDDSFAYSSYNLYFGNTVDRIDVTNDEGGNVEADPLFVNVDSLDYRLAEGSPALNAGTDVGLPYEGTAPEIGAYEGPGIVVGVDGDNTIPTIYALEKNYPNPFNPTTTINYSIPENADIRLIVYNVMGQEVVQLVNQKQVPGYYSIVWRALDSNGKPVSSGIYLYRLVTTGYQKTRTMLLIK